MANLNQLQIVPIEKDKTGKWLSEQLGRSTCTVINGVGITVQPDHQTLNDIANLLNIEVSQ